MKNKIIKIIKNYQKLTKGKNSTCRYHPTCSNYAIECFKNYNFFKASFLSFWRILRCNPLSNGGYDPIPKVKKIYLDNMQEHKFNPLR
jgi:hypothetical protein